MFPSISLRDLRHRRLRHAPDIAFGECRLLRGCRGRRCEPVSDVLAAHRRRLFLLLRRNIFAALPARRHVQRFEAHDVLVGRQFSPSAETETFPHLLHGLIADRQRLRRLARKLLLHLDNRLHLVEALFVGAAAQCV